jgi:hypothetical protein
MELTERIVSMNREAPVCGTTELIQGRHPFHSRFLGRRYNKTIL